MIYIIKNKKIFIFNIFNLKYFFPIIINFINFAKKNKVRIKTRILIPSYIIELEIGIFIICNNWILLGRWMRRRRRRRRSD